MKIPFAENAQIDIRKLKNYCLNSTHDEGKHKARLFLAAFGMTSEHSYELRNILLKKIITGDAKLGRRDEYGQRYILDFVMTWNGKQATVRSGWILEHNSQTPRLTTCYPL